MIKTQPTMTIMYGIFKMIKDYKVEVGDKPIKIIISKFNFNKLFEECNRYPCKYLIPDDFNKVIIDGVIIEKDQSELIETNDC